MDFYELDLNDLVLDALDDMNFTDTTPIQERAIPPILEGKDVMGVAQTGTGKTAAYLLPILSLLQDGGFPKDAINCVIMSPTRELAQQIDQAMQGFSYYLDDVSSVAVYGGNDGNRYEQEKKSMRKGADVVIATPGRLISHLSLGNVDLSKVSFFVLDEADRMLDMGFYDDIITIAKSLPANRQTIMFSATMPRNIMQLAQKLLNNPVEVKLSVSRPADAILQQACICYAPQKIGIIKSIFKQQPPKRVIIFTGSKVAARNLSVALTREGFNTRAMHSDLDQSERDNVMFEFRSGKTDILVATDIVARGIDIDDIQMVINFEVPHDEEDYVHRIGRTARAGRGGRAITLVDENDQRRWHLIEKFLGKSVERIDVPSELGDAPDFDYKKKREDGEQKGKGKKSHHNGRKGKGAPQKEEEKAPATTAEMKTPQGDVTQATEQKRKPKRRKKKHNKANKPSPTQEQTTQTATPQQD